MFRRFLMKNNKILYLLQTKYNTQYASSIASELNANTLLPDHIQEAVKEQPKLGHIPPQLWRRAHVTFIEHGLQTQSFLRVVCGNPAVLARPPEKIKHSFELWRSCQFGEKLLHLLLIKYPELFDVSDDHKLLTHISFLRSYVGTPKNVWKLLMNSPDLVEQSELRIEQKLDYITKQMRIEIPEIIKSEALSKSLAKIRCRHVLLERLGLFKPRPLKSDPNEPTQNHRLYQICDTSEKTFATKVCHIRLEEFEAFQELYKKEREWKQRKADDEGVDVSESSDDEE